VDIAAGMYAYAGILAALHHRARTGEVLPVDVSLFDSLTEWLSYPLYWTMYGGDPPRRTGTRHAMIVPYGAYATAGGEQIMLAVQSDAEWVRFCAVVLEDPGLTRDERFATNERRVANPAAGRPGRDQGLGDGPALGQQTRAVLDWLGLGDPEQYSEHEL